MLFYHLPSAVDFTKPMTVNTRTFVSGFYKQNPNEDFTFVSNIASLKLGQRKGMSSLEIQGFLPSNFTDVKSVSVYINSVPLLQDANIQAGEGFQFVLPITPHDMLIEKVVNVELVFDAIHQPELESADIRQLSSCITAIRLK